MKNKKFYKKINSFISNQSSVKIIAICILISVLMLSVCAVSANCMQNIYETENRKVKNNLISNISDTLNEFLSRTVNEIATEIYVKGADDFFGNVNRNPQKAKASLKELSIWNNSVNSIVAVSDNNGDLKYCSSNGSIKPQEYVKNISHDYQKIKAFFNKNEYNYDLYSINKPSSSEAYRYMESFCAVIKVISPENSNTLGFLFVNFNSKFFRDMIGLANVSYQENFIIISQHNEVLLKVGDYYTPENLHFDNIIRGYIDRSFTNSSKEQVEVYGGNENSAPYKCVLTCKKTNKIWNQYNGYFKTVTVLITVVAVLLVLLFVFALSISQTLNKVKNILKYKNKALINRALVEDANSLEGLTAKQLVYSNMLEKQNDDFVSSMKRKIIQDLFESRTPINEKSEILQFDKYGIKIDNFFAVTAFRPLSVNEIAETEAGENKEYELLRFIIENIFREYVSCEAVRIGHNIYCLCNSSQKFSTEDIKEWAEVIIKTCKKEFSHNLACGIGSVGQGISDIPQSYYRAKCALKTSLSYNTEICDYSKIDEFANRKISYINLIEIKFNIINLIKTHEFEKAQNLLEKLIESFIEDPNISSDDIRLQIYELLSAIVENLSATVTFENDDIAEINNSLKSVLYYKDFQKLKIETVSIFKTIVHKAIGNSDTQDDFINCIIKIVEDNYSNHDMSVSFISQIVGKNPRTISAKFIKKTGRGLLDYIHSVRIDKAKELLCENKLTVQEVSENVGYDNANTFIRVFKKYCDMTPGQYQELYRKK